jgi:glucan phosphoethanolaminetransferase (alkaline phosphatase superfamily)
MLIVVIIVLAILWFIRIMNDNEWLPDGVLDFLSIVVVSIGLIYIYILYFGSNGIARRNLTNYDEVYFQAPDVAKDKDKDKNKDKDTKTISSSPTTKTAGSCSTICPTGYKYNTSTGKCE